MTYAETVELQSYMKQRKLAIEMVGLGQECALTKALMQRAAWIRGNYKHCPRCGRDVRHHCIRFIDKGIHGICCTGCCDE